MERDVKEGSGGFITQEDKQTYLGRVSQAVTPQGGTARTEFRGPYLIPGIGGPWRRMITMTVSQILECVVWPTSWNGTSASPKKPGLFAGVMGTSFRRPVMFCTCCSNLILARYLERQNITGLRNEVPITPAKRPGF